MTMLLDTLIFDPSAFDVPKPRIPVLPDGMACLSLSVKTSSARLPSVRTRHFSRGRYALHEAYRLAGIGPGNALMAPAYHCRTMLDPALALESAVLLYPLGNDLAPDLAALDDLFAKSTKPVKALLATHFFGIPQPLAALATWCAERKITLIEDCSHVLYCEHHQPPGTGVFGDFVVSSPYKFVPSPDGGLLYSRKAQGLNETRTRAASITSELRGMGSTFANSCHHRSAARTCNTARIDAELAAIIGQAAPLIENLCQPAGWSADYRPLQENIASLRFSRLVCRHADISAITRCRRENYRRWADALVNTPRCRPLFPELPDGCIPYMLPVRIEKPHPYFCWLKRLGVPLWRWDSIAASTCSTALDYRLNLLHLPCHQALSEAELTWMIAAFTKTMIHRVP